MERWRSARGFAFALVAFGLLSVGAADAATGACSGAGRLDVIDNNTQCVCSTGYSGRNCEACAVGYDRDRAGKCVFGDTARRQACFNKGTPYLNQFGDIACRCNPGFSGPHCGGPDIAVDGHLRSVEAGGQLPLKAAGGSGSYQWQVPSGRGSIVPDNTGKGRVYLAPEQVNGIEIVKVKVRDVVKNHVREFNVTVTPPHALALTGVPVPELASFDQAMLDFMKGRGIRAGVLAVAKDGVLVLSRGYGYMDKGADADPFVHDEGGVGLVAASTPFRLASVSKPITAAAVRAALEDEGLDSNEPALPWIDASLGEAITSLGELHFPYTPDGEPFFVEQDLNNPYECADWQLNSMPDSRWNDITIEHLLAHRGGFDRGLAPSPRWTGDFAPPPDGDDTSYLATSGDPNFKPALMIHDLATATGLDFTGPLRPKALTQYMAGICLGFAPGSRQEYSNFGYTLLGRVLEGLHGQQWSPGDGGDRRFGWGPYIDILEDFLADYGVSGIRAGGTGSFSSDNVDWIGSDEPYYRHLSDDGSEPTYLNVADAFGINANGDMYFGPPQGVPTPYGAFSMQTMEAHGGLVASAPGLIKFMRHFRLRSNSNWSSIGTPREDPSVGNASHWGLLPGTWTLAWQMPSGNKTYNVPLLTGAWDQSDDTFEVITIGTNCNLPTGIDVVALFNQSTDPKDTGDEYGRLSHFLGKAACQVQSWPGPLPLPEAAPQ